MEVYDNETGGPTVKLYPGDRLSDVKGWHRKLLTPDIVAIFEDVPGYFRKVADKAPVPAMAEWLDKLLTANNWTLELHKSNWSKGGRAGFYWKAEGIVGAEMGPPMTKTYHPTAIGELFELIGFVDWFGFSSTGELHPPVPAADVRATWMKEGQDVDLECSTCWGDFNGDILIEAPGDRGGWVTMDGRFVSLGTVRDSVEWVFRTMLAGKTPILMNLEAGQPGRRKN